VEGIRQLHLIDFFVIGFYFTIIAVAGNYLSKYIKDAKDYFTAGGNLPWWLAGISFWMTGFSALSFVVYSEMIYKYGLTAITIYIVGAPALFIGGYFFAGKWRRARQVSPIGFVERRFSPSLKQIFIWTGIPLRVLDNGLRIYATAVFLTVAISNESITFTGLVWATGIFMIFYSFLGGQFAVVITDFVQFILIFLVVSFVFPLAVNDVGGFSKIFEIPDKFALLAPPYDIFQLVTVFLLLLIAYNAGWGLIQKYNCVRTDKDAKKVAYSLGVLNLITPFLFFAPALFAIIPFPELENPRFAYIYMGIKVLPVGLVGVLFSAMLSATMSSLASEYNTISGVVTNDFYKKKINKDASDKQLIFVGRINTILIGLLTTLFAYSIQFMTGMNLFDIMIKAFTAFAPAIMLPLLAGLLFKKVNSKGAYAGIVAGFVSGSIFLLLNIILVGMYNEQFVSNSQLNYWLNQGWSSGSILLNISITSLALYLGSKFGEISDDEKRRTEEFFKLMDTPYVAEKKATSISPFPAIGITLSVIGIGFAITAFVVEYMFERQDWLWLNLLAALIFILLGGSMWYFSKRKEFAG